MPKHELSQRARTDLSSIGRWTKKKFGEAQTERYLAHLERDFEFLAANPRLGRLAGTKPGQSSRRFESGSHVVFYELTDTGILVGRILHKRMLPKKHGL
jgi:toxin ParE1/3/4